MTDTEYTGIKVIDDFLNGGETPLKAEMVIDAKGLLLPIAILIVGVILSILVSKKIK